MLEKLLNWLFCQAARHDYKREYRTDNRGWKHKKLECSHCHDAIYYIWLDQWVEYWGCETPLVYLEAKRCHTGQHYLSECPGDQGK
jgi:hypothetical protein